MTLIILCSRGFIITIYSLNVESKSAPPILASILSKQLAILSWNPHCSLRRAFRSSCRSWIPNKAKGTSWNPRALHPSSLLPSASNSTSESPSPPFRFLPRAFSNFPQGFQLDTGFPRIAQTDFRFLQKVQFVVRPLVSGHSQTTPWQKQQLHVRASLVDASGC